MGLSSSGSPNWDLGRSQGKREGGGMSNRLLGILLARDGALHLQLQQEISSAQQVCNCEIDYRETPAVLLANFGDVTLFYFKYLLKILRYLGLF